MDMDMDMDMDMVVRRIVIFGLVLTAAFATDAVSGLQTMESLRNRVKGVFYHAYENYLQHAFPLDELRPLTCDGQDTWGSFSLTLIDALDTLLVLGNTSEFRRVSRLLQNTIDFTQDVNVSVFETNIRVVGGLLSAHMLSKMAGIDLEPGWPCTGPLLRRAEDAARKLLPAFHTKTGMPYGTVNLLHGVHATETPVTCTAGVGTFILEFATLSRLTGDPAFEEAARRALRALWESRSDIGLVGNHINVNNSHWMAEDAGIGAGVDSYFEYLIKGAILLQEPKYMEMFQEFVQVIEKYMKHDDWYMWVHMSKGTVSMPVFQSLEAFWPGLQSLVGDIDSAMKTLHNYHQVWQKYGGLPEFYNIPHSMPVDKREGYPLRPELVESAMYLYRATKDPFLLHLGQDVLEAIEKISSVSCGHATIKDVHDHKLDNRMESFFLAETTKYLYLLFDPENFLHNTGTHWDSISTPFGPCILNAGGYVFNTEAHPIDPAALYCCNRFKEEQMQVHTQFEDVRLHVKSHERTPSSTGTDDKSNMLDSREGKTNRKPKIPVMSAPSQPYTSRLSIMGQMFLHQDV